MNNIKPKLFAVLLLLIQGCSHQVKSMIACDVNVMSENGRPCWVNSMPREGVVVSGAKHVIPAKTREMLLIKAVSELAISNNGIGVAQDAVIQKITQVKQGKVSEQSSITGFMVVTSDRKSQLIKASIKDMWEDTTLQKLYLWVVLEDE